jgi:hypothetical protein
MNIYYKKQSNKIINLNNKLVINYYKITYLKTKSIDKVKN